MLQIRKLSTKTWKHIDTNDGAFILTKFYAKEEFNEFLIVESYGAKRRKYLINEIEVYDIGGTAETFANFEDLFLRLEALKYIGFYKDGDVDLTPVYNAINSKVDKVTTSGVERTYIINADGSQGTKATSDFKDVIQGYYNGTNFYTDAGFTNLITPESSKIYLNIFVTPATQYRWSGSAYVQIGGGSKRTWILSFTGALYFDGTSGNGNWSGLNATLSGTFGLLGGTNGIIFQTPVVGGGLPNAQSPARVIPYNCKIKSFHIRNGVSPFSAVNPANFLMRFYTHTPNGTTTLNNPILQASFNSTGFNMPANYIYPSSCFTNNNLTLQAGDVITPIMRGLQALTAGALISDFYLEFEEI